MTDDERFEVFVTTIKQNRTIWLLEAKPGLFAMLEDRNENSYIPVWHTEEEALKTTKSEWEAYQTASMHFNELHEWLKELENDGIDIAVLPDENGKIFPLKPAQLKQFIESVKS